MKVWSALKLIISTFHEKKEFSPWRREEGDITTISSLSGFLSLSLDQGEILWKLEAGPGVSHI